MWRGRGQLQIGAFNLGLSRQCRQHIGFFNQPFGDHDIAKWRVDALLKIERVLQVLLCDLPAVDQQPANRRVGSGGRVGPERAQAQIKVVHFRMP